MVDLVKWHPNERVDVVDIEKVQLNIVDEDQRWGDALFATAKTRILDGFTQSGAAATMTITLGKAVAAEVRGAATRYGQLLTEGLASQNVDFTGRPVATYGVYVRFAYAEGTKANRAFWDDFADAEQQRLVNTRQVAGWGVTVATTSPGPEWIQIYSVAWDGSALATSTITDTRPFFFEGPAGSTPAFTSTWGGGDDRDADRAAHGVKDLERFAAAVIKKLEEIQSGSARWWTAPVEPLDQKVSRNGDLTLDGDYKITGGSLTLEVGAFGTEPDPDTHDGLVLEHLSTATGRPLPIYFLHDDDDGARDGMALYTIRTGTDDDDISLSIASIVDSDFVDELLRVDAAGTTVFGTLTVEGGLAADLLPATTGISLGGASPDGFLALHLRGQVSPTTTDANELRAPLIPKAVAHVVLAASSGAETVARQVNIASVTAATNKITVVMSNAMSGPYLPVVQNLGRADGTSKVYVSDVTVIDDTTFEIRFWTTPGPTVMDPLTDITGFSFGVVVFGFQT